MKIICIGKNYSEHIKEMKSAVPTEPVWFMKPETAVLKNGDPFFLPDFSKDVQHEVEIILRVCKNGKNISEEFAADYYDEIGIGIDFTARDLQAACKEKGLPWERAKSFDGSAPLGEFIPKGEFPNENDIDFHLELNGKVVQKGNTKDQLFSFSKVISHVSKFVTLKKGDLIYTGTPEGVGSVKKDDLLEGFICNKKRLSFHVK